jgi:hypothetical protein
MSHRVGKKCSLWARGTDSPWLRFPPQRRQHFGGPGAPGQVHRQREELPAGRVFGPGHSPEYGSHPGELPADGCYSIVTHPERNELLQRMIPRLEGWVGSGFPLQVTAQSLMGEFGRAAQHTAEELLERGLVWSKRNRDIAGGLARGNGLGGRRGREQQSRSCRRHRLPLPARGGDSRRIALPCPRRRNFHSGLDEEEDCGAIASSSS